MRNDECKNTWLNDLPKLGAENIVAIIIVAALLFFFYCYLIKLVMRREDKHRVINALELRIGIRDK